MLTTKKLIYYPFNFYLKHVPKKQWLKYAALEGFFVCNSVCSALGMIVSYN
jgi:hypothetical protein